MQHTALAAVMGKAYLARPPDNVNNITTENTRFFRINALFAEASLHFSDSANSF